MDNIFKTNQYRMLELFIENPRIDYSARGMARELGINHVTVLKYLKELLKLDLIKVKNALYPLYYANTQNKNYQFYKINKIVFDIKQSRVVEYIHNKTLASAIVLFGSCSKGTYNKESDIDIFVESTQKKLNLSKYEKILKKKINLIFHSDIQKLSENLRINVINGITLYGNIR